MIFVAEKYGSRSSPVRSATFFSNPSAESRRQMSVVRRSCQTMAGPRGWPVFLSQNTAVSRWLAMPIPATWDGAIRAEEMASRAAVSCVDQISSGSCSTQPGFGYDWVKGFWDTETALPVLSKRIARELVVPWSRARM